MHEYKLVRFVNDNIELNVNVSPEEDTVWLSLLDMCALFNRDKSVISRHIKSVINENCLNKNQVVAKNATTGKDGKTYIVAYYNLEVIIPVGYKVKSKNGIIFRKWANTVLKDFLIKGYALSNRAVITKDNYISLVNKVTELDQEVKLLKKEIKLIRPNSNIFYSGQYYDSYLFIRNLLKEAHNKVVIIDPYMDDSIFDYIKIIKKDVFVLLIHSSKVKITSKSKEMFIKQYFNVNELINDTYHDRFIIIDDSRVYHLGTSLNYLGNKTFVLNKINDSHWVNDFIRRTNNYEQ